MMTYIKKGRNYCEQIHFLTNKLFKNYYKNQKIKFFNQ